VIVKTISSKMLDKIAVIINSALAHDKVSLQALEEMSGTKVQIISNSPPFTIYLKIDADQVTLSNEGDIEQNITLSGSLVALVSGLFGADEISTLYGTGLTANGDTGVLKKLNKLMTGLNIDWEAAIGKLIGPMPAHLVTNAVSKIRPAVSKNKKRICEIAIEVAQEELRLAPTKVEFDNFSEEIQLLSSRVDRLEAHFNSARRTLKNDSS
jgi:ubiquinone biosynthesis protein UbiJ